MIYQWDYDLFIGHALHYILQKFLCFCSGSIMNALLCSLSKPRVVVNRLAPLWLNDFIANRDHSPILDPVAEFYHSEWSDCFCKQHSFTLVIYVCCEMCLLGPRNTKLRLFPQSDCLQTGSLMQSTGGEGRRLFSGFPRLCTSVPWGKKQLRPQQESLSPFL